MADAIREAEALIEFKASGSNKEKSSKKAGEGKGGVAKPAGKGKAPSRETKASGESKSRKPIACFLCDGPHMARDCPSRTKLAAMLVQEEPHEPQPKLDAMRLLGACKTKVGKARRGPLYAEVQLAGQPYKALIDTGASDVFITGDLAQKLGLKVEATSGTMKAVNTAPKPLIGIARQTNIKIGEWEGLADICVVEMDDYDIVLGLEFLEDHLNAAIFPRDETMLIRDGRPCAVPLLRGSIRDKMLSAMQLSKGVRKGHDTFIASLIPCPTEESPEGQVPQEIMAVLKEFEDVMPAE